MSWATGGQHEAADSEGSDRLPAAELLKLPSLATSADAWADIQKECLTAGLDGGIEQGKYFFILRVKELNLQVTEGGRYENVVSSASTCRRAGL